MMCRNLSLMYNLFHLFSINSSSGWQRDLPDNGVPSDRCYSTEGIPNQFKRSFRLKGQLFIKSSALFIRYFNLSLNIHRSPVFTVKRVSREKLIIRLLI